MWSASSDRCVEPSIRACRGSAPLMMSWVESRARPMASPDTGMAPLMPTTRANSTSIVSLVVTDLAVTRADGVLRLHLDREEKRNALNGAILDGMLAALRDPGDARVVLVTSAGKVFCSGADLVQMAPDAT